MEQFFEKHKCPIGRMITIWGDRLGFEEWAIREAAEEYWEENKDNKNIDSISVSWDILSRTEAKRPVIIKNNTKKGDPELRVEINRLRGVIANLREAISDLSADKEEMWGKMDALKAMATHTEKEVKELRKDNLAFSGEIEGLDSHFHEEIDNIAADLETIRRAAELDKLETESKDLKSEVKNKRRWWSRK